MTTVQILEKAEQLGKKAYNNNESMKPENCQDLSWLKKVASIPAGSLDAAFRNGFDSQLPF